MHATDIIHLNKLKRLITHPTNIMRSFNKTFQFVRMHILLNNSSLDFRIQMNAMGDWFYRDHVIKWWTLDFEGPFLPMSTWQVAKSHGTSSSKMWRPDAPMNPYLDLMCISHAEMPRQLDSISNLFMLKHAIYTFPFFLVIIIITESWLTPAFLELSRLMFPLN